MTIEEYRARYMGKVVRFMHRGRPEHRDYVGVVFRVQPAVMSLYPGYYRVYIENRDGDSHYYYLNPDNDPTVDYYLEVADAPAG